MKITKIIQWDMGHRILNHRSVCKGLHGHRYKAEITVEGKLVNSSTKSEHGMVMDFADIKSIAKNPKQASYFQPHWLDFDDLSRPSWLFQEYPAWNHPTKHRKHRQVIDG